MEDAIVRCERCGRLGARVHRGWHLLCDPCRHDEMADWFDDKCGNCGHSKRSHGDRAISACVYHIPAENSFHHRTVPCNCVGWKQVT
jgi:hypothetical protein